MQYVEDAVLIDVYKIKFHNAPLLFLFVLMLFVILHCQAFSVANAGEHMVVKQGQGSFVYNAKGRRQKNPFVVAHWSDGSNGLAIGGIDPVAYFDRKQMVVGSSLHELTWHGVAWRFQNEGNMQAFMIRPLLYAPGFAGFDPFAITQGRLTQGHPGIWEIYAGKLLLFHNEVNRFLWSEARKTFFKQAQKTWPDISQNLSKIREF